jgi:hypothetical protein
MSTAKPIPLPQLSQFEQNRMRIPDAEWQRYEKMWVGLSLDGRQILAGAPDLIELDKKLRAAGSDVGNVSLEFVDFEDDLIGGQAEVF